MWLVSVWLYGLMVIKICCGGLLSISVSFLDLSISVKLNFWLM